MSIDWAASGAWAQAWAGIAQAGAVVAAAYMGTNVFKTWRRQKIEERRMDAAERILTLAYRVRRALSSIRHPMMWAGELSAAEKKLEAMGVRVRTMREPQKRQTIQAQAMFDRIEHFKPEWDEMAEVTPVAAALFGRDIEQSLG